MQDCTCGKLKQQLIALGRDDDYMPLCHKMCKTWKHCNFKFFAFWVVLLICFKDQKEQKSEFGQSCEETAKGEWWNERGTQGLSGEIWCVEWLWWWERRIKE